MRYLSLTNSILRAIVDDEDYDRCREYNWRLHAGSVSCTSGDKQCLAKFILNTTEKIDHKDINGLNNQKSNLRICNQSQNQANRNKLKSNKIEYSSKYKGVSYDSRANKYQARITHNGKTINIGNFKSQELAAKAYDGKAKRLFGEFAVLNFPDTLVQ